NSLQGKVKAPVASSVDPARLSSTGTVCLRETPWIVKVPVTEECATRPLMALVEIVRGVSSENVAVGKRSLSRPMEWIFSSRIERSLFSVLTATLNDAAEI